MALMENPLQRQIFYAIGELSKSCRLGQNLQIVDGPPDGDAKLVSVDDASKGLPASLSPGRLGQQVFVLTEKYSTQRRGSVEEVRVFQPRRSIKLRGQHVHSSQEQTPRDGRRHVHVHVEADAHVSLPISRNRFRIGDSPVCARIFSTSCAFR